MPKNWIACSLVALALAVGLASAQSPSSLFDQRKAEKELQVMEGILQTTLKFVTNEISDEDAVVAFATTGNWLRMGGSSVDSFYLYDQGAVFVVDLPGIRTAMRMADARAIPEIAAGYARVGRSGRVAGQGSNAVSSERLLELQEKVKQQQEEYKKEAEQHRQRLDEVKGFLVEALANHGDSLTVLGDDEYINLVLNAPSEGWLLTGTSRNRIYSDTRRPEYISVKKSWISDYKAGRLALDQFKAKALSY